VTRERDDVQRPGPGSHPRRHRLGAPAHACGAEPRRRGAGRGAGAARALMGRSAGDSRL
jgi:hypothetical protein